MVSTGRLDWRKIRTGAVWTALVWPTATLAGTRYVAPSADNPSHVPGAAAPQHVVDLSRLVDTVVAGFTRTSKLRRDVASIEKAPTLGSSLARAPRISDAQSPSAGPAQSATAVPRRGGGGGGEGGLGRGIAKPLTIDFAGLRATANEGATPAVTQFADAASAGPRGNSFRGQDLSNQNLSGRDLESQDFAHAKLHKASLQKANLCHANLYGAELIQADLRGADLRGANLNAAMLRGWNPRGMIIDARTLLPFPVEKARALGIIIVPEGYQPPCPRSGTVQPLASPTTPATKIVPKASPSLPRPAVAH